MIVRRFSLPAVALLVALAWTATAEAVATRALVIGVNAYPQILLNGVPGQRDLRGAVADAKNVEKALVDHFDVKREEIRLLIDEAATRDGILAAFREWLIDGTNPGDRVIFYFAGHGAQVEDENGDEGLDRFDEVLAPHDTKGELQGADAGLSGFITDDEIGELLDQLAGREVLVIVDACHSGTITRGALQVRRTNADTDLSGKGIPGRKGSHDLYTGVRTLTPNGPLRVSAPLDDLATREAHRTGTRLIAVVGTDDEPKPTTGLKLAAWTAAASAQVAMEDLELGGKEGLFTNRFVKGIAAQAADLNGNGKVTAAELLTYLRSEAERYCAKHPCGAGGMTPTLEAWDGYDGTVLSERPDSTDYETYGDTIASTDVIPTLGGVTVKLSDAGSTELGDRLRVEVDSKHPGQLIVLDVRDDGTTIQLFPNRFSLAVGADPEIAADGRRFVPGDEDPFELVPDSRGSGRIVALVADSRVPLAGITGRYLELEPIASPEAYVAEISRKVNSAVSYPTGSEAALEKPAKGGTLARGEARYTIY